MKQFLLFVFTFIVLSFSFGLNESIENVFAQEFSVKTIKVGNQPNAISIDPKTNLVYVGNTNNDEVYVVDGYADELIEVIFDKKMTHYSNSFSALNENSNKEYRSSTPFGKVTVKNIETGDIESTIYVANGNPNAGCISSQPGDCASSRVAPGNWDGPTFIEINKKPISFTLHINLK